MPFNINFTKGDLDLNKRIKKKSPKIKIRCVFARIILILLPPKYEINHHHENVDHHHKNEANADHHHENAANADAACTTP